MTESRTTTPLHERLRRARIRAGLNQTEAAKACGTSREYYNRVEVGAQRSPEILVRLARALGVRISLNDVFPESGA
jgi:transcriptional regulator with XRE-family HTH domain